MAATIESAIISARVQCTALNAADIVTSRAPLDLSIALSLANGAGANKANTLWFDTRTLTASSTESLDVAGGLTDVFGNTLTYTKIKVLLIRAAAANTNNVIVGNAASNQFIGLLSATGTITLRPGAMFLAASPDATGMAVTAGTGDLLKVANSSSGTSVLYDIVIIGEA